MKKIYKKFFSLLLCAVMLLGSVIINGVGFAQDLDAFTVKASAYNTGDDYPQYYKNYEIDVIVDEWNFYNRECTSFVAWCINSRNGIAFNNTYLQPSSGGSWDLCHWSHAKNWINAAQRAGITVNQTPAVGAVACWTYEPHGHVAWVKSVNANGTVNIDEYNYRVAGGYGERNNITAPYYIHFENISTVPSITGLDYGDDFYAYIFAKPKSPENVGLNLTAVDSNESKNNVALSFDNSDTDPKQIWHFIKKNNSNQYEIVNEYDGKALDISSTENFSNVQTYQRNNSSGQLWAMKYVSDGAGRVFIYSVANPNMALDVSNGAHEGNNIQIYNTNETDAQMFYVYKLDWNPGYNYSVPKPAAPKTTSLYAYGNVMHLKWTESPKVSIFDTIRKYEVWINDSNNTLVDSVNVGDTTECTYFLPRQGTYNIRVVATSCSYNTSAVPAYTSSETKQVSVRDEACSSFTDEKTGNVYLLYDTYRDFNGAKQYCEALGGHLATITSSEEQEIITELCENGNNDYYWLGGTDEAVEGSWKWITGEDWDYTNWNEGEPSNSEGAEDYLHYIKVSDNWNDTAGYTQIGFVCEIENPTIQSSLKNEIRYKGNKYKLFDQALPWTEAKTYCESVGGHLVTINSSEENDVILSLISGGSQSRYWIGAANENTDGWSWVTDEDFDYTNWNTGEPSNDWGIEKYAHIFVSEEKDGLWNDASNYMYINSYGFICEFDNESYTINFDANGGICSTKTKTVTYNSAYGTLPIPSPRKGFVFLGWYDSKTGGNEITADTKVIIDENQTLYAHWEHDTFSIKADSSIVVEDDFIFGKDIFGTTGNELAKKFSNNNIAVMMSSSRTATGDTLYLIDDTKMIYETKTVIIFGDVNCDGWYDGMDAIIVNCIANGLLSRELVGEAVYMAADCNHDGIIDSLDVDILNQTGVLLASVDQSKSEEELLETNSAYVEYLNLIDQTIETKTAEAIEDESVDPDYTFDFFDMILNFIKELITVIKKVITYFK